LKKESNKTTPNPQRRPNNLLDLTGAGKPEERYLCEDCDVQLYLYPKGAIDFPLSKGPHYICPQCHIVIDLSMSKPPGMDEIKPIDMSPPSFVIIPEDKGDNQLEVKPYDPEPDEDKWLKNIGATLISKKVEVRSDF
jgi:hypothetical protein